MTTLAIIGAGILGRSLIYTLAKEQKNFEKITLISSDSFAFPCTFHSTATVAPRGLSKGHSPLGDFLLESFQEFSEHVELDQPLGVKKITQYTAATEKLDSFIKRYPDAKKELSFFREETLLIKEEGFMIDPRTYADWLLSEADFMEKNHRLEIIEDFVTEVSQNERVHLKTINGRNLSFDKVVFTGGNYNRFWKGIAPDSKLKTSKPVQGSYLEFHNVPWDMDSFALTYNSENIVWDHSLKRLLIGSTTIETNHVLPDHKELMEIYSRLQHALTLQFPPALEGKIKTGLREKAQKRGPYIVTEGDISFMGGLYKNGFTVSLRMARSFAHQSL